jgi:serine/threonine-protein kinase
MGRETMLGEIVERPPVPFAERGIPAWPALEDVLRRGLSKDPADRFPSMAAFAAALAAVAEPSAVATRLPVVSPLAEAADKILAQLDYDGRFAAEPERGPTASVNYGAAGIAYALYRIAAAREDGRLLALADAWCTRAEALSTRADAFENEAIELSAATIGSAAPLHARSGVAAVRAAIARAQGDDGMHAAAVAAFVEASADGHKGNDLALGRAGTVLHAALLIDALPAGAPGDPLLRLGRAHLDAIWRWVDEQDDIASSELGNLGIAHGWAGLLYATLQWHRATGSALPSAFDDRLEQLARLGEPSPSTRGVAWPWSLRAAEGPATSMPGWCNGTAGHVSLWCLAHQILRDERYLARAAAAAWEVWDAPDAAGSLCCGLVGRAYALLRVHRATQDPAWLRRAVRLGERVVSYGQFEDEFPLSLYKGRLSIAVLAADLERPESAVHPFFEEERWPVRAAPADRLTLTARAAASV